MNSTRKASLNRKNIILSRIVGPRSGMMANESGSILVVIMIRPFHDRVRESRNLASVGLCGLEICALIVSVNARCLRTGGAAFGVIHDPQRVFAAFLVESRVAHQVATGVSIASDR